MKLIKPVLSYTFKLLKRKKKLALLMFLLLDKEKDIGIANHDLVRVLRFYRNKWIKLMADTALKPTWHPSLRSTKWEGAIIDYTIADIYIPEFIGSDTTILDEMGTHPIEDFAWTKMMHHDWQCTWMNAISTALAFCESRFDDDFVGKRNERTAFQILPEKMAAFHSQFKLLKWRDRVLSDEKQLATSLMYGAYSIMDHVSSAKLVFRRMMRDSEFITAFGEVDEVTAFLIAFRLSYIGADFTDLSEENVLICADFISACSFYNQLWCKAYDAISKSLVL